MRFLLTHYIIYNIIETQSVVGKNNAFSIYARKNKLLKEKNYVKGKRETDFFADGMYGVGVDVGDGYCDPFHST